MHGLQREASNAATATPPSPQVNGYDTSCINDTTFNAKEYKLKLDYYIDISYINIHINICICIYNYTRKVKTTANRKKNEEGALPFFDAICGAGGGVGAEPLVRAVKGRDGGDTPTVLRPVTYTCEKEIRGKNC